jgi:D-serine deaminase-like pyridoxal phosphate-dependent protein
MMKISELDTPALLIDLDRLQNNLRRVADYCSQHALRLRPHTKTHKNPAIGRMQLDLGAVGLTVAKTSEAEVMLASGTPDLLIAYPIVGEAKLAHLVEVANKTNLTVALDSREAAQGLSQAAQRAGLTIGVLAEADVGMRRCGLEPGPALVALAQEIDGLPGLRLEGVQFYPGHFWANAPNGPESLKKLREDVAQIRDGFRKAGLPLRILSGGSSPTLYCSHTIEGLNEVRPGTYVFNDCTQVAAGVCTWDDCAVTILTTVVSTPRTKHAIVDGGSKTFTSDPLPGSDEGTFGRVVEVPDARFHKMNEEHGFLDLEGASQSLKIGERVRIIPNHVCVAVNMHEKVYGVHGETVEEIWEVAGRGKLQ